MNILKSKTQEIDWNWLIDKILNVKFFKILIYYKKIRLFGLIRFMHKKEVIY